MSAMAFSPDGQSIAGAVGNFTTALIVSRASDGERTQTLAVRWGDAGSVAYSPDGRTVAATQTNTLILRRASDGALLRAIGMDGCRFV